MLQQTRVSAVIPYYERFLARFPTPADLAAAPESELLALWSGLGYYSRARNLQEAARQITQSGSFPRTYAGIRELKGVGAYTAAAVASIAFHLPYAVLDGNVMRVLARLTNDAGDIQRPATRARLQAAVNAWLDPRHPGRFNQALMELGATVCLPRRPQCWLCPVAGWCAGRQAGRAEQLPVKSRPAPPIREERTLLLIERAPPEPPAILLTQRRAGEQRLAGFWELPEAAQVPGAQAIEELGVVRHAIVNYVYKTKVVSARTSRIPSGFCWVELKQLGELPITTMTRKALRLRFRQLMPEKVSRQGRRQQ